MKVPGIVQSALRDEQVAAQVSLSGEDELYVTPTRTIIYRGDGLLSDETVEEYTHQAERVVVKKGRRKGKITLYDGVEGDRSFSVPPSELEAALHPVLAGVLNAAGVTEPGETVKRTFSFSELTVIVTSRRLVKHIGEAVWDTDYEEYRYEDATGLDYEEGSVATQIVLEVDGRRERIKAPNEQAPELRAELEEAVCEFYDVPDVASFEAKVAPDTDAETETAGEEPEADVEPDDGSFGGGLGGLDAVGGDDEAPAVVETTGDGADSVMTGGATDAAAEPAADTADVGAGLDESEGVSNEELAERLDEMTTAVRRQNELLETHAQTIEQLIEELKRM